MTTMLEATNAVYSRFVTQWGTTTPFVLENEAFDEQAATTAWIRVSVGAVQEGESPTLGPIGSRKYRRQFSVFGQVFTPVNEGMAENLTLQQQFRDIFEGAGFSGLDFNSGVSRKQEPDDRWQPVVVEIVGNYEETK